MPAPFVHVLLVEVLAQVLSRRAALGQMVTSRRVLQRVLRELFEDRAGVSLTGREVLKLDSLIAAALVELKRNGALTAAGDLLTWQTPEEVRAP